MARILQWKGDGLSPGTLTIASAGLGDTAPTQISLISGTTATIVATGGRSPAIQIQEAAIGSSGWLDWNFSPTSTAAVRVYFTPSGTFATNHAILSLRRDDEARVVDVNLTDNGAVRVYDIDNTLQSIGGGGTIVPGTTYRFEVAIDAPSGVVNIAIFEGHNTTPIVAINNLPGNYTADNIGCFRIGKNTTTQKAETQTWDDIAVDSGQAFIGPSFVPATISAGGTYAQIEPFSTVTLTGVILTGEVTTWGWSQLTGPAVTLNGSGISRTFIAPHASVKQTLTFQVTADSAPPATATVEINSHLEWIKTGGSLIAQRPGNITP